jgi:hypothetical protein
MMMMMVLDSSNDNQQTRLLFRCSQLAGIAVNVVGGGVLARWEEDEEIEKSSETSWNGLTSTCELRNANPNLPLLRNL